MQKLDPKEKKRIRNVKGAIGDRVKKHKNKLHLENLIKSKNKRVEKLISFLGSVLEPEVKAKVQNDVTYSQNEIPNYKR